MIPSNAVCRPEDYMIEDEYPVIGNRTSYIRTLKKYTGTDRIIAVPEGVHCIDPNAFANCPVWEVYLPAGLKEIGASAFKGCHLLKKVSLPEGLTVIGPHAFEGCFNMEEIEIPGSVSIICQRAFWFCLNLLSVTLRPGVQKIDAGAFGMCNRMSRIEIPDTLESIHPGAISCSEQIQVIASDSWKKSHPDLLMRFHYIHDTWDSGRP